MIIFSKCVLMCIKFVLNVLRIVNFIVYRVNDYGDIILSDM